MYSNKIHPKLKSISVFSMMEICGDNTSALLFLEESGLVPSKKSIPPQCCGIPMKVENDIRRKLGWMWRCRSSVSKGSASNCRKILNPSDGSFFDGKFCHISISDALAILFCFVMDVRIIFALKHLNAYRQRKGDATSLSTGTITDYYSHCREVTEIISSHTDLELGNLGRIVLFDETFLAKRKYNRGRFSEELTINVVGLFCKEDRTGLFFKINHTSIENLWPYIAELVDQRKPQNDVFSDEEESDYSLEDAFHKGKILNSVSSAKKTPPLSHQNMGAAFYRRHYLAKFETDGERITTFLQHIREVYPGYQGGVLKTGLFLKEIDPISETSALKKRKLEEKEETEIVII
ncbi:uncharacterized protein LOC128866086 isoform X1 [Anastrepha ludens]|uniref:uncharacterized protein LOC128866086 isoform X1 n=1 Tax=Anastrepha ludens TaxID=28586 RepID=UPI0023B0078D|nr:uncharacterized protein LOC128866086 isoform X1 [Anastrepha ludens]